jgi:hypothetical protein
VVRALGLTGSAVGLTLLALATTAELFALAWAAMRRGVSEIAVAGVIGSVAYNATATLGVAALIQPLSATGLLAPAIAAAALPLALLAAAPRGRLGRTAGAVLTCRLCGVGGCGAAALTRAAPEVVGPYPEFPAACAGRRMPVSQVMLARTAAPDLTETRTRGHLGKLAAVKTVST